MGGALRAKISYRRCDATRDFRLESAKGLRLTSKRLRIHLAGIDYERKDETLTTLDEKATFALWTKLRSLTRIISILKWIARTAATKFIAP